MVTHMLVQLPLLALAGALLAGPIRARLGELLARADPGGIATVLAAVFTSSYWMLPRALDSALADPWMEAAKLLCLPLLVGVPIVLCLERVSAITAGFFIANVLSMCAAAGWLYRASPARLCNYYLIEDQVQAGEALLSVSAALAVLWLVSFFLGRAPFAGVPAVSAGRR